jgi:hypothetical protein
MLSEPHLGLAVCPVVVAREAQDRQQQRLRELVFAKCGAITEHRGCDSLRSDPSRLRQPHFRYGQQRISPVLIPI